MALRLYKPGQGRYVRLGTAGGAGLVALVICYYVYTLLAAHVPEDFAYKVYVVYAVPALLFAGLAVLVANYLNNRKAADFLIATEGEMKKVSWSSKAEVLGSTMVVIMTVIIMAVFIFVVDYLVSGTLAGGCRIPFTGLRMPGLGLW
ncbi:MAG: preprotein translocase subunit SecE [Planctomycetota bacterium]|nr:preprotein translocase subunit SecE [Planctomycetota bacterium]